jgi:hypothetical protein
MMRFKLLTRFSGFGSVAAEFHRDWIAAREQRLARGSGARICSLRWGVEALEGVPRMARKVESGA